ncbi:MAG: DUF4382 domain-containing protein [Steroidobacteraceae bacterium]
MKYSTLRQSASSRLQKLFNQLFTGLGVCGMLMLSACGGSGGGSNSLGNTSTSTSTNTGAAMITLTDAPGDFLHYAVTVDSLQLTRGDGTVFETVSNSTLVDFAQLVDLSEIISAAQVPAGKYVSVTLTLDYYQPTTSIVVDNGTTSPIMVPATTPPANNSSPGIFNATGTAALSSPVTMTLTLPSGSPLVITPGTVANLALDFNLLATNTVVPIPVTTPPAPVTSSTTAVQVWVSPALSASLTPDTTKQIRVRGPLVSVGTSSYTINVRPFFNATGTQGQFVVNTTATTAFTINGMAYVGNTLGLPALQAAGAGTPTIAYGSYDVSTGTFTASNVLAGTNDSVEGTVTAVSVSGTTTTLTVENGMICRANMNGVNFSRTVFVTVGSGTVVTEEGQSSSFNAQDISVGQHLQVFGTYSDTSGTPTLDALNGSAFLMVTDVWGLVQATPTTPEPSNVVTLTLQALDGLPPSAFTFTGTGAVPIATNDASASAYTVGVAPSLLPIPANLNSGPTQFRGFVTPFGTAQFPAPPPDFSAVTLVNYANTNAQFVAFWMPGITTPFGTFTATSPTLALTSATLSEAQRDLIRLGPESINPATLGVTLQANSAATTRTQFVIVHRSSWKFESFSSFADLVSALYTDLNGTTALLGLFADGPYDTATGVLSVDQLEIALSD